MQYKLDPKPLFFVVTKSESHRIKGFLNQKDKSKKGCPNEKGDFIRKWKKQKFHGLHVYPWQIKITDGYHKVVLVPFYLVHFIIPQVFDDSSNICCIFLPRIRISQR